MALWRFTNDKTMSRSFFNRSKVSMDAYVCCPGPSLKFLNPEVLNKPNVLKVALNNAYPYVRPDVWFGMDDPRCYNRQIFWEPFIKIMRGGYQDRQCEGRDLDECFNLYYADCAEHANLETIFTTDEDINFLWRGNVVATAIHVILWMGIKKIYLLGCDLSLNKGAYYNENIKLSEQAKLTNSRLYKELVDFWRDFSELSPKYGVEVVSCTADSRLNDFIPYLPVEVALDRTKNTYKIPTGGKLFHSKELS